MPFCFLSYSCDSFGKDSSNCNQGLETSISGFPSKELLCFSSSKACLFNSISSTLRNKFCRCNESSAVHICAFKETHDNKRKTKHIRYFLIHEGKCTKTGQTVSPPHIATSTKRLVIAWVYRPHGTRIFPILPPMPIPIYCIQNFLVRKEIYTFIILGTNVYHFTTHRCIMA